MSGYDGPTDVLRTLSGLSHCCYGSAVNGEPVDVTTLSPAVRELARKIATERIADYIATLVVIPLAVGEPAS